MPPLTTPDGRYLIVRGRLWRATNPALPDDARQHHVAALMDARRAVKHARQADDADSLAAARRDVDAAKHALGERGPVWWRDGAPDYNRHMVHNSPYADWYAALDASERDTR
ncbi:hypothetical protein CMZ84_05640 [Lysobacteraceae bacterium NML93-0399]|nr:hypothetical protein CMZ84_05640 [Xanthomonadaceae bacterium NML93-0399]